MKLRKKLTMTIIGLVINWLGVWLATKGIELSPEQQTVLYEFGTATSALIVVGFNIGQGIADKGKEVGKALLIFLIVGGLTIISVPAYAQSDCSSDLEACIELLDECSGNDCLAIPEYQDCEKVCEDKCGWVALIKDKTFMTTVLGSVVFLIGGIAGIFFAPN